MSWQDGRGRNRSAGYSQLAQVDKLISNIEDEQQRSGPVEAAEAAPAGPVIPIPSLLPLLQLRGGLLPGGEQRQVLHRVQRGEGSLQSLRGTDCHRQDGRGRLPADQGALRRHRTHRGTTRGALRLLSTVHQGVLARRQRAQGAPGQRRAGLRGQLLVQLPPADVVRTRQPREAPPLIHRQRIPTSARQLAGQGSEQRENATDGGYSTAALNRSVLLESALLLRSHHDLLRAGKALLLADLLEDESRLVIEVLVEAVLLDFLDGEWGEEGVLLDDFPGVKVELGVDGALGLVQNVEAAVVRLSRGRSTSSIGRCAFIIRKFENSCRFSSIIWALRLDSSLWISPQYCCSVCSQQRYMGSTSRGPPPRNDSMQASFTVEITCPAIGPKLSVIHDSSFFPQHSTSFFDSPSVTFVSSSSFTSGSSFFSFSVFSSLGGSMISMLSMMKMTPIICSLARGPELQAREKPFLMEVVSSLTVVLYSSRRVQTEWLRIQSVSSCSSSQLLAFWRKECPGLTTWEMRMLVPAQAVGPKQTILVSISCLISSSMPSSSSCFIISFMNSFRWFIRYSFIFVSSSDSCSILRDSSENSRCIRSYCFSRYSAKAKGRLRARTVTLSLLLGVGRVARLVLRLRLRHLPLRWFLPRCLWSSFLSSFSSRQAKSLAYSLMSFLFLRKQRVSSTVKSSLSQISTWLSQSFIARFFSFSSSSSSASARRSALYCSIRCFFSCCLRFFYIYCRYFSFLTSFRVGQVMVSRKVMIGSDVFIGHLQQMVSRSTMHFSRWTCPQVFRMMSPVASTQTSTEGSERFSFFRPSSSLGESLMSGVDTLTLRMDLVWEETETKEMQSSDVERVPDLKMKDSRPAIPTTQPAWASLIPSGYCPLKKQSPVILAFVTSGTSIISPVQVSTCLGLTPITSTSWLRRMLPEQMRAKPIVMESSAIPQPSPRSLICLRGTVIIFETKAISGASQLWLQVARALRMVSLSCSPRELSCRRQGSRNF